MKPLLVKGMVKRLHADLSTYLLWRSCSWFCLVFTFDYSEINGCKSW